MQYPFDAHKGLAIVNARLYGPSGTVRLRLALDTGATMTIVRTAALASVGYDPALSAERIRITTASGIEFAPRVVVERLELLNCECRALPILAHTLPPSTTVDGLLGLDFFRGRRLALDFREGWIEVT